MLKQVSDVLTASSVGDYSQSEEAVGCQLA
jgi:hypothetical protein